jgi:hypothetical protein
VIDPKLHITAVVGCQRSGTTLVGQILGAHPNAILLDEFDGLYPWFHAYAKGEKGPHGLWQTLLEKADSKYVAEQKRTILGDDGLWALKPEITHLILKAPNLTYEYQALSDIPNPVQVIYPVRDARAVVYSMGKLSHIPFVQRQTDFIKDSRGISKDCATDLLSLEDAAVDVAVKRALVWKIKSTQSEKFEDKSLPTFGFRYEDLVGDMSRFCGNLARHAHLDVHDQLFAHEGVYQGEGPGGTLRTRAVDKTSLESWKLGMSKEDQELVLSVTREPMKALEYLK